MPHHWRLLAHERNSIFKITLHDNIQIFYLFKAYILNINKFNVTKSGVLQVSIKKFECYWLRQFILVSIRYLHRCVVRCFYCFLSFQYLPWNPVLNIVVNPDARICSLCFHIIYTFNNAFKRQRWTSFWMCPGTVGSYCNTV